MACRRMPSGQDFVEYAANRRGRLAKGFPEAIEAIYPHPAVQLCIVHMVRNSLNYVS